MNVPIFEYTAASGKKFRAVTLQTLLEVAGLKVNNPRAIYGAQGTPYQGVPIVLLELLGGEQNQNQNLDEDSVLALLHRVLRGRTAPADAARVIAQAAPRKRGRPRKAG